MFEIVGFLVVCLLFAAIVAISWYNHKRLEALRMVVNVSTGSDLDRRFASIVTNTNQNDQRLLSRTETLELQLNNVSDSMEIIRSEINRQAGKIRELERTKIA